MRKFHGLAVNTNLTKYRNLKDWGKFKFGQLLAIIRLFLKISDFRGARYSSVDSIEDNEVLSATVLEQKGGLSDLIWILVTSGRLWLRAVERVSGKFQSHQKALEKLPERCGRKCLSSIDFVRTVK